MTNKLMLLAIIFSLVLSLGVVIACGDDDDDDDDDTMDDDTLDDDDDDTMAGDLTCEEAYTFWYDTCGYAFYDEDDVEIPLADLIGWCELDEANDYNGAIYDCINDNYENGAEEECDDIYDCLEGVIG